jgi:Ca2+-binding EF-hand superfamily protein
MKSKTTLFVLASLLGAASLATAEEAPKRPDRPLPPELLKKFDKDGDGKLSEEERAAMRAAGPVRNGELEKKMLEKFDTDKDGKLSDEEKAAAKAAREKEMLEKFDVDKDGKLSEEERKAARESFGPRGPKGPKGPKGPDGPPPAPPAGN